MPDTKVKGIVDIVVLFDITGSMGPCIEAVKANLKSFVATLTDKDANDENPIKDWRMKVCGYRDYEQNPENWFVDNPFVTDVAIVEAQIDDSKMQVSGGGDEPESLLDALHKIATMDQSGLQDGVDPNKWRARGTCARSIIFFTDASFKLMSIPEAPGGNVVDILMKLTQSRIILNGFFPPNDKYEDLGTMDGAYCKPIPDLNKLIETEPDVFTQLLKVLAKTIVKSSYDQVITLD